MDTLWRDLKFALRGLVRTPAFTAAAVLALALGIGATTAIFSVVHAVLLRSLGWGDEGGLIAIHSDFPGHHLYGVGLSPPEYADITASGVLPAFAVEDSGSVAVRGKQAERVRAGVVTSRFFSVLGVTPVYGRSFTADEDAPGRDDVAILSAAYFHSRFGGDPAVVGRTITVDGKPRTVVGVLPESFRFGEERAFYIPLGGPPAALTEQRSAHFVRGVGRLRPGQTLEQARAELAALSQRIFDAHRDVYSRSEEHT